MKTVAWTMFFALSVISFLFFGACEVKVSGTPGGINNPDNPDNPDNPVPGESDWTAELGDPIEIDWSALATRGGYKINVDETKIEQIMEGFGASDCWSGNFIGQYWNEDKKQQIADWLFSQEFDSNGNPKGIGLSEWRVNLGAGSWEQGTGSRIGTVGFTDLSNMSGSWERRAESFLADINNPKGQDGKIAYNWNKQAGQQYFMAEAKKRGTEVFVLFSNSPPVPWTRNGFANKGEIGATVNANGRYTYSDRNSNLKSENSKDFADYMADVAEHFVQLGYPIKYISPVNEPQWEWNEDKQEGTPWTNAEIARIVKDLDASIQARPSIAGPNGTKIMIAETAQWDFAYSGAANNVRDQINTFFESTSANYVGNLVSMIPNLYAGHTYFTHTDDNQMINVRTALRQRAEQRGVKLFSTEWCALALGTGIPNVESATYYEVALFMAKLAHSDIYVADTRTWSFWTAFDMERGGKSRYSLIGVAPGSEIYDLDSWRTRPITASGSIKSQPTLWALGNYSLFVRPGFQRIELEGEGINTNGLLGLMGTAYKSPPGYKDTQGNDIDRIVSVYVNFNNTANRLATNFSDGRKPRLIRGYLTNENNTGDGGGLGLRRQTYTDGTFSVPGRSILTVVYDF